MKVCLYLFIYINIINYIIYKIIKVKLKEVEYLKYVSLCNKIYLKNLYFLN